MRAIQVTAPGKLRVADVPEPDASGQALVKVQQVGICGTDVKILSGGIQVAYPRIMGHEMVGKVVRPGPEGITPSGQRVLVDPAIACGHCALCGAGRSHLCINGGLLGRDADGVFAEYVAVPEVSLVPVPESLSDAASGLLQVLGTCVHAQRAVSVFPGDVAVVIGLGVSGQLFVQLLRAQGAIVVGVTRTPVKRALAARNGAAATTAPAEAAAVVDELSRGRGADLVVEAAGTEATLRSAVEFARVGGQVLAFGTITDPSEGSTPGQPLPHYEMYRKELAVLHPRAGLPADYQRGIELTASGTLQLDELVTHRFALVDADAAFAAVHDPETLKIVMDV